MVELSNKTIKEELRDYDRLRIEHERLQHENERLRRAIIDLMNEYPTRADAMVQAHQALNTK